MAAAAVVGRKQRKFAVMGYRSVGKSSLTIQFVDKQFVDNYNPTIEYTHHKSFLYRGEEYNLTIVDTAGQDKYSIFPNQLAVNVHGFILVYSVTSRMSFEVVRSIYDKLLDSVGRLAVPLLLVGNKMDLHKERVVTKEEGRALAAQWRAAFIETSAREYMSACDLFSLALFEVEKMYGDPRPSSCSIS
ncbi:GTP-binding protein Rheb-like [Nilaparvata lugens]|uniref:GTP-binding protein Rheb-like n=1 Tax=Nilaparvata lugens TaxID=108931 RepID=UPI000B97D1E6|nr:GTP-binding protein Rheb-like [Nilaparvata lugens]